MTMNGEWFQVWGKYPAVFLIGLIATIVLTAAWRRLAPRLGLMDLPDPRRLHGSPMPSAGGIAIMGGFHLACAAIYLVPWLPFAGKLSLAWWLQYLAVSLYVLGVGLLDDRFRLKPAAKLAGQGVVALLAYALGMRVGTVFGTALPLVVDVGLTVAWFLMMMNAFNLIDGMDGLAAGLGVVAAAGLGLSLGFRHQPSDVLLCLALAGACLGFLRHNFHPAAVFMGDTGSMFIGCTIAAVALGTSSKGTAMASIWAPILAAGVPILDTGLAVWRRSVRSWAQEGNGKELAGGIAAADKEHLHHRLLKRGWSQRQVALALYGFGAVLCLAGVVSAVYREYALGVIMVTFLAGAYVVVRHLAWIELLDSGEAVLKRLHRRGPKSHAVVVYPVLDLAAMAAALALSLGLMARDGGTIKKEWESAAPWAIGLPFLLLVASKAYGRVWSMARVSEYALTALAAIVGILLWMAGAITFCDHPSRHCVVVGLLYVGLGVPLIVGSRVFVRGVQDLMAWQARVSAGRKESRRILLIGAGADCLLFLKEVSLTGNNAGRISVVGMVDDDVALWGRWVHGYRVLGGLSSLEDIARTTGAGELVVLGKADPAALGRILGIARARNLVVRQWTTSCATLFHPETHPS
jgi:UDP-N-acetylmuramyl pentapeptide phosphotransferase/UDP-N-acetylglucosamine-1-phosphate transferase